MPAFAERAKGNRFPVRMRGRWQVWLIALIVLGAAITIVTVHLSLVEIERGLPVKVLRQERDVASMVQDLLELVSAVRVARIKRTPDDLLAVRARLAAAQDRLRRIRASYNFDNLVGASAMHAVANPALIDIGRWLDEGISGYAPSSDVVLDLIYRRAGNAYAEVKSLYARSNASAVSVLAEETRRIESLRTRVSLVLFTTTLLMVALVVVTLLQRRAIRRQRVTETALIEAKESAEFANRAKSEFLANMSHELRTPLNAILGFSEIMHSSALSARISPEKLREYARDIHASGTLLLEMINDILDLSKAESGKLEISEERVDVRRSIEACLRLVRGRAEEGGVRLGSRIAEDLPEVRADARQIKQILLNLLSNAIKFTETGGRVTVGVRMAVGGGIEIAVEDTGIGMAPEHLARALEPFVQIETAFTRRHAGTGLGLPLVQSLVALHGGHLTLRSEPGVGTTATAWLPPERVLAALDAARRKLA